MIKIQAHPNYINQLRIFDWAKHLQVDWHSFLDYCRFSNIATIVVEGMTITFLKTSSSVVENFEWRIKKPYNEPLPEDLAYIMNLKKYDLEFATKIQKDKVSRIIYCTYFKRLN